jgi:putative endonuclease
MVHVIARRLTGRRGNLLLNWCRTAMRQYWVYMMTNRNKTVIYTGVTNDLSRRVQEHRDKEGSSFAKRYNVTMLVYYESFSRIYDAIAAEKRIKAGSRAKKIALIESANPGWKDLYDLKIASLRSQ